MQKTIRLTVTGLALAGAACATAQSSAGDERVTGWLDWRGPDAAGVSHETDLLDVVEPGGDSELWRYTIRGRGTPVIAGGRVYAMGYSGEGKDLREGLLCIDAATGKLLWEDRWSDFISDTIYDRYAIGSPTIDPETGNVFALATPGVLSCYTRDGVRLWSVSMMEELGRLTFPNGRTGAPVIDGDNVIVHVINAHWGKVEGPAADRFYAFDKSTGDVVWWSTPGVRPIDSSFSHPVIEERGGRRVLYACLGCGSAVGLDARTGEPLWRFQMSTGGANCSPVIDGDNLIVVHGKENTDTSTLGRMVTLPLGTVPAEGQTGPVLLPMSAEGWRADLVAFTSSPVLVGRRIYQTVATGELYCVNADTGETLWHTKLAPDQIHASPVYGDGKLYVPMTNGSFHVIRPTDEGPEKLCTVQLEGNCLGAPAIAGGRIYVHTTEHLYCFGSAKGGEEPLWPVKISGIAPGPAAKLQIVPADALLRVGEAKDFRVRALDAGGNVVPVGGTAEWTVPPVLSGTGGAALAGAKGGTGMLQVRIGDLVGAARIRVVDVPPWAEDFEGATLDKPGSDGTQVAFPPGGWIGAFKKWEVVDQDGNMVLRKTLDVPIFQRAMGFTGHPDMSDYTVQVDIMTDGSRRILSGAGVVNQRYLIELNGNARVIQVTSTDERILEAEPFRMKVGEWYTLKTRVDVAADGSGVVRGKAWPRDEPEPAAWTIEVEHATAHTHGSPGIFGFTPQSRFHVYLDNYSVTPND